MVYNKFAQSVGAKVGWEEPSHNERENGLTQALKSEIRAQV